MVIIPADYWLILCLVFTDFPYVSSFRHLTVDVSPWMMMHTLQLSCHSWIQLTGFTG